MSELKIGYARVSTDAQDLAAQRDALDALGVEPDRAARPCRSPSWAGSRCTARRSRCRGGWAPGLRSTPCWETLAAQALAGAFVIGSYYLAEYVKVSRPRKQGLAPTAVRATSPPTPAPVMSRERAGAALGADGLP